MTPLKISRFRSRRLHPKTILIWGGGVVLLLIISFWAISAAVHSNHSLINQHLDQISQLSPDKQETPLKQLYSATGGDQTVARALADFYTQRGLYQPAAKALEQAHPSLLIEAASTYAAALDYKNVARVAKRATNQKPTAQSLSWQALASLNVGDTTLGCNQARDAVGLDASSPLSKQATDACNQVNNQSDKPSAAHLYELGLALLTRDQLQRQSDRTIANNLLLAKLQQQSGDSPAALDTLGSALRQSAFDRSILQNILNLCKPVTAPGNCSQLKAEAQHNLDVLPEI